MRSRHRAAVEDRLFRDFVATVKVRAMFLLDAGGRVVSWNAGAAGIHGFATVAIVGQPFSVFFQPRMKVLYVSGYADDVVVRGETTGVDVAFLPKPFSTRALGRMIEELYERSSSIGDS